MPETTGTPTGTGPGTPPGPPPPVRLKSAVRARSLAAEGVALSMGATAVVVRGSRAEAVWRALEPSLRAGFDRPSLLGSFPEKGRPFLAGILDQLEEHGFLRALEPEPASLTEAERAAYPHLEAATRRPYAALAALRTSTVRVRSACPLLEAQVRRALARAGFGEVHADTRPGPGGPVLLTARVRVPDGVTGGESGGESEYVIAADGGLWLTGPRNLPGTPDLSGRLRTWLDRREPDPAYREPDGAALRVTRALVAAQSALALVAHVARSVEDDAADDAEPDPEFMVTTDELVSEPHTLLVPEPLDPTAPSALPAPEPPLTGTAAPEAGPGADPDPLVVPDRLDALTHLWDRVFGPLTEPAPGDLPQLPVGLALSGDRAGCGFTTAQAREDALVNALHEVVWHSPAAPAGEPAGAGTAGLGLGLTQSAAIGGAVGDLVLNRWEDGWKDVGPPVLSPAARRMWTALTLRCGVPAELTVQELDGTGLLRARVVPADGANPGDTTIGADTVLGASVSPDPDACVREALLRAVATVRLAEEAPRAVLARSGTGTEAVTSALARWALGTGAVRVSAPGGSGYWRSRGVHSAVAVWT
ncbi:hypothetical protein ACWFMI_00700 [Nocardiopsis terrae]